MKSNLSVICFGELLLDVVGQNRHIGGAPLNVCYHLSRCGIDSRLVSQVGDDQKGIDLISGIRQLGVNTSMVSVSPDLPTSEVLVQLTDEGKATYTIVENVAWDAIPFNETHVPFISEADCFVFGSLALRSNASRRALFRYLEHARWKVIDLNLREPYFDKQIIHQLLSACHTLKINDDELRLIVDYFDIAGSNDQEQVRAILNLFPNITEIILTLGAEGAKYVSQDTCLEVPAIKVEVVDTVGSGDAFLAAFLSGKLQQKPVKECLQDAAVLSSFIAGSRGACPLYESKDLNQAPAG